MLYVVTVVVVVIVVANVVDDDAVVVVVDGVCGVGGGSRSKGGFLGEKNFTLSWRRRRNLVNFL